MKKKILGWVLWFLGIAYSIGVVSSGNPEYDPLESDEVSKQKLDPMLKAIYEVRLRVEKSDRISKEAYLADLVNAQEYIVTGRNFGYIAISGSMGMGTILILLGGRNRRSMNEQLRNPQQ